MIGTREKMMVSGQTLSLANLPEPALGLLLEGYEAARDLACDLWEFAVEIAALLAEGLTNSQLRWLLNVQYLQHAVEKEKPDSAHRVFAPLANGSLPARSCFILTPEGAGLVRARLGLRADGQEETVAAALPCWDQEHHQLRLGSVLVKEFTQPAEIQELVFRAFQEECWKRRIDDPLPPAPNQDPKRRLNRTVRNLNRGMKNRLIEFGGGGDGESICWRVVGPA
jgi:hypothetical protein